MEQRAASIGMHGEQFWVICVAQGHQSSGCWGRGRNRSSTNPTHDYSCCFLGDLSEPASPLTFGPQLLPLYLQKWWCFQDWRNRQHRQVKFYWSGSFLVIIALGQSVRAQRVQTEYFRTREERLGSLHPSTVCRCSKWNLDSLCCLMKSMRDTEEQRGTVNTEQQEAAQPSHQLEPRKEIKCLFHSLI